MNEISIETQPHLSWTADTDCGRVRTNNEDSFLALMFNRQELAYLGKIGEAPRENWQFIFAVSDGMGGRNAGEFASRIVVQTITELISREFHQHRGEKHPPHLELVAQFFQTVHKKTLSSSRGYSECQGMGATLSMAWFVGNQVHVGHIGDSRIYHLPKEGQALRVTEDHTIVDRLLRYGKINEREARSHPQKHLLERSIGTTKDPIEPQLLTVDFRPGDRFVLCTDGVTDGVWDHGVERLVRTPPPYLKGLNPAQRLIKEAKDSSGRDNITAMVVEVSG